MLKIFAFWGALSSALIGVIAYELTEGTSVIASQEAHSNAPASAHGETAPAAAPAPHGTPAAETIPATANLSHAELRERYHKRLEEIAHKQDEAKTPGASDGPSEDDVKRLHALLKDREQKLTRREETIAAKERDLAEKQSFLDQQLGKYESTLAKLRLDMKALESARDEKIAAFRQVYEKMEPKKAARILDDLEPELSGKVLAGMKQTQAAEILGKMDPEKARRITKRFLSSIPSKPEATQILSP